MRGPGYGIVVVPDEVDLGVEVWFLSPPGDWSWSMAGVSAEVVRCLSWRGGVFVSWGLSDLLRGVTQAFFQCGRTHVLHDPHHFFVRPSPARGVLGSVGVSVGGCFSGLVVGVGCGVMGLATTRRSLSPGVSCPASTAVLGCMH